MNALNDFVIDRVGVDDIVDPDAAIRRLFHEFRGPDLLWMKEAARSSNGLPAAGLPDLEKIDARMHDDPAFDYRIRELVGSTKLRAPIGGDLTEEKLARELRSMVGYGRAGLEDLYELTGVAFQANDAGLKDDPLTLESVTDLLGEHIVSVATRFAKLAVTAPKAVRFAFQGAIATASAELYRSGRGKMKRPEIIELLEELARFHLVDSLLQAGDEAHARVFETTGFDFLDANGDRQTTKGCILKRMDDQLELLLACLRLFALRKDIPADDHRLAHLEEFGSDTRVTALEAAFQARYGSLAEDKVHRIVKRLTKRIRKMQRGLRTLKGQAGFRSRPAWIDRGPNPYQLLYLNCSFAAGWLEQHQTVQEERDRDATSYASSTRIQVAIRRSTRGDTYAPCRHRKAAAEIANRLFFTLRNICVADPRSDVGRQLKDAKELASFIDAFRIAFEKRANREARVADRKDVERWPNDVSSDATKAYEAAAVLDDPVSRAFVDEARGRISIRLTI